jgi:hypothetical protein
MGMVNGILWLSGWNQCNANSDEAALDDVVEVIQ